MPAPDFVTVGHAVRDLHAGGWRLGGTISFAAELDSPYLREPSTVVAELTGRPAKSVRQLLLENRERLREAAAE